MTPGSLFTFDVARWTGLDLRHIPKDLRDEHGFADTRSWAGYFDDQNLMRPPHELLLGTWKRFGDFFDVTDRQAREIMLKGHCHRCGGFPITVVRSAQDIRVRHETDISSVRAEAGRRSGEVRRNKARTDVGSGTSATSTLAAHAGRSPITNVTSGSSC
jgi:hypothetical protein